MIEKNANESNAIGGDVNEKNSKSSHFWWAVSCIVTYVFGYYSAQLFGFASTSVGPMPANGSIKEKKRQFVIEQGRVYSRQLDHSGEVNFEGPGLKPSHARKLRDLPLLVLQQAYEQKKEEVEDEAIDPVFRKITSLDEKNARLQDDFARLTPSFIRSTYWLSKTEVELGGVASVVRFFLRFYGSDQAEHSNPLARAQGGFHSDGPANSLGSSVEPANLAVHLGVSFSLRSYRTWEGMDPHLEHLREKDGRLFGVVFVDDFKAKRHFSHIAISLPISGSTEGVVQLLNAQNLKWSEILTIRWASVSRAEYESEQNALGKIR